MLRKELGVIVKELPPTENNPRNSEGAFLTLPDKSIIFVYSRFKGSSAEDFAAADICMLRSTDNGKSFGEEKIILTCDEEDGVNIMSLSLLRMENGDIGLFYLVRTTYSLMRMFLRRSPDGGRTWGERVLCTPQEGFFVVNNDRVTRLESGRIIIPAAIHRKGWKFSPEDKEGYFDSRADSIFFYSDDDGRSWLTSDGKCCMPYTSCCRSGLQEPGVIELSAGILWAWARTDLGRQYEMFSLDNGNTWTAPQPSAFTSPNSPLCMKRAENGTIYAVWNPIPNYNGREEASEDIWTGGRSPYVIAVSKDNAKSFTEPVIFEEDEFSGFCYCAIHFVDNAVLLAYCAGGKEEKLCLAKTRIRRILLEELEV